MKKLIFFIPVFALISCSFVKLDPQANAVNVSTNLNSLNKCKFLGNTTVSIWSKANDLQSQETVDDQLDTLARNEAAKMHGDTVISDSKINAGQKIYRVYNCTTK